uniref:Secreted protein n=1 Tax=Mycena chlorophos TaxID=658473 RepID=A0ABQ0KZ53_MYCCL|nr:predicted protein [Mycena chlorophos]
MRRWRRAARSPQNLHQPGSSWPASMWILWSAFRASTPSPPLDPSRTFLRCATPAALPTTPNIYRKETRKKRISSGAASVINALVKQHAMTTE